MKLGEKQKLTVVKKVDFGIYLAERAEDEKRVLLPAKQAPQDAQPGDMLEVFLYRDSEDRLIATKREPLLMIGETAVLKALEVGAIGAFLDWGLEKDLFLPYKEMTAKIKPGDEILVTLYIDKSERLCATMRGLYELLRKDSPYKKGDMVTARIYEFSENFGTFAAVDDTYSAMIPLFEDCSRFQIGDVTKARVSGVKPDGKLDLTLREKVSVQMDVDAGKLMEALKERGGMFPFNDKASPEVIFREVKMSKNAFKRAIGRLYKLRKIEITENAIRMIQEKEDV